MTYPSLSLFSYYIYQLAAVFVATCDKIGLIEVWEPGKLSDGRLLWAFSLFNY